MKKSIFNILVILFLTACSQLPINLDNLDPDDPVSNKLPLDLNVKLVIAAPSIRTALKDNYLEKEIFTKRLIVSKLLEASGEKIAKKYFKEINAKNSAKSNLIALLKGDFKILPGGYFRSVTASIDLTVFNKNGELLFSEVIEDTESVPSTMQITNSMIYNAVVKSQMSLYDKLIRELKKNPNNIPKGEIEDFARTKIAEKANLKVVGIASGFFVNNSGYMVTNSHVVENCLDLEMIGESKNYSVEVLASDSKSDIALLKTNFDVEKDGVAVFESLEKVTRLGEDSIAIGYPLSGELSSQPTLTKGNISALAGPGNDETMVQFTAPIQSGSSGSPLINNKGNVIGIVSSTIDALQYAANTGQIPQNVNYAIKNSKICSFLQSNGVKYSISKDSKKMDTPDIADKAIAFTRKLTCHSYVLDPTEKIFQNTDLSDF